MSNEAMKAVFAEQERDEARRHLSYAMTAIRNALSELEDDDIDGAIETLKQIVKE